MEREDRNRYDRHDHNRDYDRYEGYNTNDEHYHSARNLTNQFEQEYQRERGYRDNNRDRYQPNLSYHEGDRGDAYENRRSGDRGFSGSSQSQWNDRSYNRNYSDNYDRDRSHNENSFSERPRSSRSERSDEYGANVRRGYGISDFGGTSDRYNTLNSADNRRTGGSGEWDRNRGSRSGSSMGESFPSSNRGIPDTTYGARNFSDEHGAGLGSTYGSTNYGGGTGYSGSHQGGTFGSGSGGASAGNYGGYGPGNSSTYGRESSRGQSSRNSGRGMGSSDDY